jgi:3-deoxy-D-manno-octulosonate 8-phosphate phosphatase (KDO 8-P phosphatase)
MSDDELNVLAARIELLVLDVDGVLTDGSIMLTPDGGEIKTFHVRDGSALTAWLRSGKKTAIISGRASPAVSIRAAELGIREVRLGVKDKGIALSDVARSMGTALDRTCAIGDDWPDLPVLTAVALPVAVADAAPEVRAAAKYVTMTPGGRGAVREVVELILRAQNRWQSVIGADR